MLVGDLGHDRRWPRTTLAMEQILGQREMDAACDLKNTGRKHSFMSCCREERPIDENSLEGTNLCENFRKSIMG